MSEQTTPSQPVPGATPPAGSPPPPAGGEAGPPGAPHSTPAPAAKSGSGAAKKGLGVLGAIIVALVIGVLKFGIGKVFFGDELADAKAGDCVAGAETTDPELVKCDDAKAEARVAGKAEKEMTEAEFKAEDNDPCTAFPAAELALWRGEEGKPGYVLCLEQIKR